LQTFRDKNLDLVEFTKILRHFKATGYLAIADKPPKSSAQKDAATDDEEER